MSRRLSESIKGIAWEPVEGATSYMVYMDESDDPQFLAKVDAGNWSPLANVDSPMYRFDETTPDEADFAVTAVNADWESDPYQPAVWNDIPLAGDPLAAPTGGRLILGV